MILKKYEHLSIGEILRLVRKEILHLNLKELAALLGKSVSLVQQAETNLRILKTDDLAKIAEMLEDKGQQKELFQLFLKKAALKVSEKYCDLTKDTGSYLDSDALEIIVTDFKKSGKSCKALGEYLDVSGPQARKILHGQMALNRKQLLALTEGTEGNPELYLLLGGHLTDNMAAFLRDVPEVFDILKKLMALDDNKKNQYIANIREALSGIN